MADRAVRVGIGAALHEQRRGLQVTVSEAGECCPGEPERVVRSQVTDEIGADQVVADRSFKGEQCETCALDRAGSAGPRRPAAAERSCPGSCEQQ